MAQHLSSSGFHVFSFILVHCDIRRYINALFTLINGVSDVRLRVANDSKGMLGI